MISRLWNIRRASNLRGQSFKVAKGRQNLLSRGRLGYSSEP